MMENLLKAAPAVNRGLVRLMEKPRLRPYLSRFITVITYTGRRSGKTISTPVGFTRRGDEVTITVAAPDHKTWWRNFLDAGGPLSMELDGVQRTGHAVATRDERGRVVVTVQLLPGT